ncbi:MAG: YegS/Rv2252/BmrU family lipid kinase [Notoacmeibacter sp.]|nr:YegS/Rv2252/BmrU family lipid kinase [Notoacmeibacter sp.]
MSIAAIVNPGAGGGRAAALWPAIRDKLVRAAGEIEPIFTAGPMDGERLARAAVARGARVVVAVGGDGTANEVANGFLMADGTVTASAALAVIPCGTGSDFGTSFGIDSDADAAIAAIASGRERLIDVGRAAFVDTDGQPASRLFVNIASFGLSGTIARNVNLSARSSRMPGRVKYLVATLKALASWQPMRIRLSADGRVLEREIMFAAVANCRYFGGGMMVAPEAEPDDGLLDLVIVNRTTKLYLARKIGLVYRGAHTILPEVEIIRAKRLEVEVADSAGTGTACLELDGESPGRLPCSFSLLPRALRVAM